MKDPEVRSYIAVDEALLEDIKNALAACNDQLEKSRKREQELSLEVERNKPITEEQAAEYLSRDVGTLHYYRTLGLNSFKKGGSRWYTRGIIDDWLASGRVNQRKR